MKNVYQTMALIMMVVILGMMPETNPDLQPKIHIKENKQVANDTTVIPATQKMSTNPLHN